MSSYYGGRPGNVPSWDQFEQQDEDDVVDTSEYAYAARDHVLFCIDASKSMQTPRPDVTNPGGVIKGKSALQQVLEAVVELQRKKVITGPSDSVGVMFWNTDPSKPSASGSSNYKPGTIVYQPLRTINAEVMKKIIGLTESAQEEYDSQVGDTVQPSILSEAFPSCKEGDELNVADVLVTCNFLFRDAGTKIAGNKRIFLITDNDEPFGSTSNRAPPRTVYTDLLTYGITINTFFVDRADHRFNPTLYWNDILGREDTDDAPTSEAPEPEGLDKLADLLTDLAIRNAPKRVQFTIPLRFGGKDGDIEIGVAGYSLVSEQGKGQPKYVRMRGPVIEQVITKTQYTSVETGADLKEDEIGLAYQFGNEGTVRNILDPNWWESSDQLREQRELANELLRRDQEQRQRRAERGEDGDEEMRGRDMEEDAKPALQEGQKRRVNARTRLQFSKEEVAEFKSMGLTPQIKILGFQSPNNMNVEDNIKHSYFIYPDEDSYTGSTRTFAALLKSCLKYDRHALALCRFKKNSIPEFAILIPQEEVLIDGGGQDMPPGFHVVPQPYVDDIRAPPKNITDNLVANERQSKLMGNIVKRLRSKAAKYRSEVYPNPALQYHYAQLQAVAFQEDFDLAQKIDEIDKTFPKHDGMHKAAGEFMAEWNNAIEDDERSTGTLTAKGTAGKRYFDDGVKPPVQESDLADVEGAYTRGTMAKLKVVELKDFLKVKKIGLDGKTKKADLIELVSNHFKSQAKAGKSRKTA